MTRGNSYYKIARFTLHTADANLLANAKERISIIAYAKSRTIAAANNSAHTHNLTFHSTPNHRDRLKAKSIRTNSRSASVEQVESDLPYQQIIFELRFMTTQYTDSLKPGFSEFYNKIH